MQNADLDKPRLKKHTNENIQNHYVHNEKCRFGQAKAEEAKK